MGKTPSYQGCMDEWVLETPQGILCVGSRSLEMTIVERIVVPLLQRDRFYNSRVNAITEEYTGKWVNL